MKLIFDKREDGGIFVRVGDKDLSTKDYITMVKEIKNKQKIEAEFGETLTEEERVSVEIMLEDINKISKTQTTKKKDARAKTDDIEYPRDDINPDDIPF